MSDALPASGETTCDRTQQAWEALSLVADPELHYDIEKERT